MNIYSTLTKNISEALHHLYGVQIDDFEFQATRKEFSGDITLVVFPLLRHIKGNPVAIGESVGEFLVGKIDEVKGFNVVKAFLNIELSDSYFFSCLHYIQWSLYYKATYFTDRFWPYKGVGFCRQVDIVMKWQVC